MSAEGLTEESYHTNSINESPSKQATKLNMNESMQLLNESIVECESKIDARCNQMIEYINSKRANLKQKLQSMRSSINQTTENNYNFKVIPVVPNYNVNQLDVILMNNAQDNANDDDGNDDYSSRTPSPSPQYHRYLTRDKIHRGRDIKPSSNKKTFCGNEPVKEPIFFKQFSDITLNPIDLQPRLICKSSYGFVPDRRGISQIYTSCNACNNSDIISCIKRIERFVLNQAPLIPIKITSKICNLYQKHVGSYYKQTKMHWHIHYDRTDWISVIQKNKRMDIFADDMKEADFLKILDIVDVFKFCYSKRGWIQKKEQLLLNNPSNNNNGKNEKLINLINKYGFTCCENQLRLIKPMENVRYITKELLITTKLVKEIYPSDCDHDAFKDMRFGLDIQKKNAFIEIRADLFFSMIDNIEINSFIQQMDIKMGFKFLTWSSKINTRINDQKRVNELLKYCQQYFSKYPQIMYWYKNHH